MPDAASTPIEPAPTRAPAAGCVVFLLDESRSQEARVAEGTRTKAESFATALNSLLAQLTGEPVIDVAIVGCRAGGEDDLAGLRWAGPLTGRRFVPSDELADRPAAVENRVRKVPGPGGMGVTREETVRFPVWYVPSLGDAAPASSAAALVRALVDEWLAAAPRQAPPLVMSFLADAPAEPWTNSFSAIAGPDPTRAPLVFHAHLGTLARVPATLYPSSDLHLPPGPDRKSTRLNSSHRT